MAKSFRDLAVWSKAIDLTELIYKVTADFPKSEVYGLASQMRRASVSIASNIAEGSARGTMRDFRHFIRIAKGSTCELQTQLVITNRLGYGMEAEVASAEMKAHEIGRMLTGSKTMLGKP